MPDDPNLQVILGKLEELREQCVDTRGLEDMEEPEPLIEGITTLNSLTWMYGAPGSGKSFVALSMAAAVACGISWMGRKVKRGKVLYIVAEGTGGIRKRVRAWEAHHGREMLDVVFLPVAVQLLDRTSLAALAHLVAEIDPVLVVVDTQARCTAGASENDNGEMSKVVQAVDVLRSVNGACVLLVHHSGRSGENLRGASAFDGAADVIVKVTKESEYVELHSEKDKESEGFGVVFLRMVPTGTSAVVDFRYEGPDASAERKVLAVMEQQFRHDGASMTHLRDVVGVPVGVLRQAVADLVDAGELMSTGGKRPVYTLPAGQRRLNQDPQAPF